jgi:alpha-tubulin suppressor-like RCC1 family protein
MSYAIKNHQNILVSLFVISVSIILNFSMTSCGSKTSSNASSSGNIPHITTTFTKLVAGGSHTCGITNLGALYCWGLNDEGQLGVGTDIAKYSAPQLLTNFTNVVDVTLGEYHTCAKKIDGSMYCWGYNGSGELGVGTDIERYNTPQLLTNFTNIMNISAGDYHTCAKKIDGSMYCWGWNQYDQLGVGTNTNRYKTPQLLTGFTDVIGISAGYRHTCAFKNSGNLYCWGYNMEGQLGLGTTAETYNTPQLLTAFTSVMGISAGRSYTCAFKNSGNLYCWGENYSGQLGLGTTIETYNTPQWLTSFTRVASITTGQYHTCATKADGSVYCWGENYSGQLGLGITSPTYNTPQWLTSFTSVSTMTAGEYHTCAIKNNNDTYCWGENSKGQVGVGTMQNIYTSPQIIHVIF